MLNIIYIVTLSHLLNNFIISEVQAQTQSPKYEVNIEVFKQEYLSLNKADMKVVFSIENQQFEVDELSLGSSMSTTLTHEFTKEKTTEFESLQSLGVDTTVTIEAAKNISYSSTQSRETTIGNSQTVESSSTHEYEAEAGGNIGVISGKLRFARINTDGESETNSQSNTYQTGSMMGQEKGITHSKQNSQTYIVGKGERLGYTLQEKETFAQQLTINPSKAGTYVARSVVRISRDLKREYLVHSYIQVKSGNRKLSNFEAIDYLVSKRFNQLCFTLLEDKIIAITPSHISYDVHHSASKVFYVDHIKHKSQILPIEAIKPPLNLKISPSFQCPLDTSILQFFNNPQCETTQNTGERFICAQSELKELYRKINISLMDNLKQAPDHIDLLIKASQKSWQKYWPRYCSDKKNIENIKLDCASKIFKKRLKILQQTKTYDSFSVFPISLYQSSWNVYGSSERVVTYDQIVSHDHSILSPQSTQWINGLLQPNTENIKKLNDKEALYYVDRTFTYSVIPFWGVTKRISSWCVGCNGADESSESHTWLWRNNHQRLRANDIFFGDKWQSKLLKVFETSLQQCLIKADAGELYADQEYLMSYALDTSNWWFKPQGISIEYGVAYYINVPCLITWDRFLNEGLSLRLKPQVH